MAPRKIPSRKPISQDKLEKSSVFKWWEAITLNPSFYDILEAARRKMKHKSGEIKETQHGQIFAAGYGDGFDDALRFLTSIDTSEVPDTTPPGDSYQQDQDLFDK